jgi:uncharacterized protein (DUF58 family)
MNGAAAKERSVPFDPQVLMGIKSLELRARAVVEGFWSGLHRSPYHGFSVEFTEYRQYSPGDDLRYLDWKVLARSDRHFIKRFEDETNLRCHLLVDGSGSMGFGSVGYSKGDYAGTLAASLGLFLERQGDAVGLMRFDEGIRDYIPARHRTGHLPLIMRVLGQPVGGVGTEVTAAIDRLVEVVKKRGMVVVISDFLADVSALDKSLMRLAACGHEVIVFQVLDPGELDLDFARSSVFVDLESGREMLLDPERVKGDYSARLREHGDRVRSLCLNLGLTHVQVRTDEPLKRVLYEFLRSRLTAGRRVRRAGLFG